MSEVIVFIQVGKIFGGAWVVLLTLATSLSGIYLLRRSGKTAIASFVQTLQKKGCEPSVIAEKSIFVIGCFYLIIPGFITDVMGGLLLLPFTRNLISYRFIPWLLNRNFYKNPPPSSQATRSASHAKSYAKMEVQLPKYKKRRIIEVKYRKKNV